MAPEGMAEAGWLHPKTVAKIYTSLLLYGNMGYCVGLFCQ